MRQIKAKRLRLVAKQTFTVPPALGWATQQRPVARKSFFDGKITTRAETVKVMLYHRRGSFRRIYQDLKKEERKRL